MAILTINLYVLTYHVRPSKTYNILYYLLAWVLQ